MKCVKFPIKNYDMKHEYVFLTIMSKCYKSRFIHICFRKLTIKENIFSLTILAHKLYSSGTFPLNK